MTKQAPMTRHEERKHAYHLIFGMGFEGHEDDDHNIDHYIIEQEIQLTDKNKRSILAFLDGVKENKDSIDERLLSHLKGWKLDRLNKTDLAILRLAVYELFFTDTPTKVVVNEAVELAKEYSSADAPKFVNGVLGEILKAHEKDERTTNDEPVEVQQESTGSLPS